MTRDLTEVHAYEIECPRCHAGPAEGCVTSIGRFMDFPHRERNQAIRNGERRTPRAPRSEDGASGPPQKHAVDP